MNEPKVKYKRVDNLVHGEVKEIKLIGEDSEHEKEKLGQKSAKKSKLMAKR